ncbi:GAF domain-containing protein [Rubellicoccus peritrichatus]|uniref:histidine kinase n=1 Tax=Rubellicoccus peritrichatus TaxID=3080537 RepID=A0AAQ3LEQ6_9BACT|nr:GAF domain-containing protein [Puniceicoccus sp. CR14]WOO43357.1 GAF domain-containing protein [Puniceicoccus sp. CR14]
MHGTREASTTIDSLYRISSLVGQTEDPHEALDLILQEIVDVLDASSASVALINPDTKYLEVEAYKGLSRDIEDVKLAIGQGITGRVALHGYPQRIEDVRDNPHYIAVKDDVRSEIAVPMITEGTIIGVVNVDSERTAAFSEEDLKVLTLLTNEATRAVSRLWLINQLKDKADQLQTLVTTGQELVSRRDMQSVLDAITREALNLMNSRICAILLLNPDGKTLKLSSLAGIENGNLDVEDLNIEDSSVGVAISRRKQVSVLDLPQTEEHHFIELTQREGLVSLLSTPIIFEDEVIGVLNAYTDKVHRFNNDEKQVFSTLASLGAVAIENTRLYSRVFTSEDSLRKNERLTTLGLLAAEIAHEIRNPLTVIKLLFDSLDLRFDEGDPRGRDVSVIVEKINHLEEIVGRVLSFGKSRTELHARYGLCKLVEETLLLVRLKLEQSNVHLIYATPADMLFVEVHKGQIQQVILNLVLNALKAMPHGGTIRVEISAEEADGQKRAKVEITDTGSGIAEELQSSIFESFLTGTRDGTGLGLSISKQILKSHRGEIELVESGSKGTTFRFWLPQL